MPGPADLGQLLPNDWEQLRQRADQLEEAWENADNVDLAAYLPASDDPLRSAALEELVKTDLEIRWRRGQFVPLSFYQERFPELGEARALTPRLIYEEYRVRHRFGDKPTLETFRERYPDQFEQLERLVKDEP